MKNTGNEKNSMLSTSCRILGKGLSISGDCHKTRLNNNVLVVGISGSNKTTSYVVPNILNSSNESMVVVDTKGMISRHCAGILEKRGYRIIHMDFVHPERSDPFNPLDTVQRYTKRRLRMIDPGVYDDGEELLAPEYEEVEEQAYRQQDLHRIAGVLAPLRDYEKDPFWPQSAQTVIESLMAYVLEVLPEEEQHFGSVMRLFRQMGREVSQKGFSDVSFFAALEADDPESFAVKKYRSYAPNFPAERCWSSIEQFVSNALQVFDYDETRPMLCRKGIDLADCGREKSVIFVNVSDTDRCMDSIVNVFYTQLLQMLCNEADSRADGRLRVPVHIYLDDFASNVFIPDFDKIVSVIRSRDVSVSIMLQSIAQLKGMYNVGQASTIINNCDNIVYMGGTDPDNAKFFADKAGRLPESILEMDLDHEWVFTRGRGARLLEKFPPRFMNGEAFELEAGEVAMVEQ